MAIFLTLRRQSKRAAARPAGAWQYLYDLVKLSTVILLIALFYTGGESWDAGAAVQQGRIFRRSPIRTLPLGCLLGIEYGVSAP